MARARCEQAVEDQSHHDEEHDATGDLVAGEL
jgi:hypothetical protein